MVQVASVRSAALPSGITIHLHDAARPADPAILESIKGKPLDWSTRWARGHLCFLVSCDAQPAAFLWIARDGWRWRDSDPPGPLPAKVDFHYDVLTHPHFRGRGLYGLALTAWAQCAEADGRVGGWQLVNDQNQHMRSVAARAGWAESSHGVRVVRVFRRVIACWADPPPVDHLRVPTAPTR